MHWQQYEYTAMKPGLGRIRRFLKAAGGPQRSFKTVHIAGTNGKGSTARMLASILEAAGYRTGLYTSPHLVRIHERMQVNSRPIPGEALESLAAKYAPLAKRHTLTFFEFITGIAFAYFAAEKIDVAVIETGLGGRFDATNVIEKPEISVITDVDIDHCQILGKTLQKIAFEKAGIIKKGRPVISGVTRPAARRVIRKVARENGSPSSELGKDFTAGVRGVKWEEGRQRIFFRSGSGCRELDLSLLGPHQARNCALALAAAECLSVGGLSIENEAVKRALARVSWPGRFDVKMVRLGGKKAVIVLDGAHNPGGMRRFAETWKQSIWGRKKRAFVFGVLADKEYGEMAGILAPLADRVILVPAASSRNADVSKVAGQWGRFLAPDKIETADSVVAGLRRGARDGVCAVTGSLYVIGEAIRGLIEITKHERRG